MIGIFSSIGILAVALCAYFVSLFLVSEPVDYSYTGSESTGVADKLGSWSQINQVIKRADNWQQIVRNSQFQLGEKTYKGTLQGGEKFYDLQYGTYPLIDGSTTCVPMALEFARQHLGLTDEDASSFVEFNTTDVAYDNLINKNFSDYSGFIRSTSCSLTGKVVDIIIATEPSRNELAMAKKNNIELIIKPVCYDAFVFITNKDNPVSNLTFDQVQKIYTGEITNWKQVGGNDEKIIAYQREEDSGSQTTMEQQVMKGKRMIKPITTNVIEFMDQLIKVVGEYDNSRASIGYTFKYYIDTLYKNENIKIIKINGIEPDNTTIQNKTYPFTTNYFGVIRAEDKINTGGKFLDWMLSDEGQKCIVQAGYCPLK
jgi:phosphate transport system substrate-binding protein